MKWFIGVALAGILLLMGCGAERGIEVHEVWMRPAAQGENGAIYFVIHNHSSQADELVGITSALAVAAEIHESKMNGDVMQMNQLQSVPLEAYAEVEFKPGGLHVMLIDLKKDFLPSHELEATLHFKNSEDIKVMVVVGESAPAEEDHSDENH